MVSSLASSAFLSSAAGTRQLQDQLLGRRTGSDSDEDFDQCLAGRLHPDMPEGKAAGRQKEWDRLLEQEEYSQLLASYTEPRHRARLLAASSDHSRATGCKSCRLQPAAFVSTMKRSEFGCCRFCYQCSSCVCYRHLRVLVGLFCLHSFSELCTALSCVRVNDDDDGDGDKCLYSHSAHS